MTWNRWVLSVGLAAAALAFAEEPQALAFGPGEQATYRVEYLGMTAGTARVTVGTEITQWGKGVLPIVSVAQSDPKLVFFPIRDKFVTYWDPAAARSIGSDLFADENGKKRRQCIKLDHQAGSATVTKQKDGQEPQESTHEIQPGTADVAAATFLMRSQDLHDGAEFNVPIFTGAKTFVMRARVEGRMTLKTPVGDREVYKIRTQTDFSGKFQSKKDMFAYLTTDPSHVPVRIEAEFLLGNIIAELTEYHEGRVIAAR
ncbi:MAG TPA: DUF3108 domain-containing protein [Myxococcaceae bacterium]|nr:DUF3108 domain-containing protein [Myxococcaceae bacterium]